MFSIYALHQKKKERREGERGREDREEGKKNAQTGATERLQSEQNSGFFYKKKERKKERTNKYLGFIWKWKWAAISDRN